MLHFDLFAPQRRATLAGLALAGALLCVGGVRAHAQNGAYYQVLNDTFSGGDPVFSITDDVTFTNLTLTEFFSSGASKTVNLFGTDPFSGLSVQTDTLDTGTIELDSTPFLNPDPVLGTITLATLNGSFDNGLAQAPGAQSMNIATSFFGTTTPVSVNSQFTASLIAPTAGSTVNIYALDSRNNGVVYGAGQFSFVPAVIRTAAVPEPSSLALLGLAGLGVLPTLRRRLTKTTAGSVNEGEQTCA